MSSRLRAWLSRPASQRTDGELVIAFAESHDDNAFAELVRRHGPMVLATCRRVLHPDIHTADDAFQAAFLVLATKAGEISPPERVGAWLHGVAVHVAKKARAWVRKVAPSAPSDLDKIPAPTTEPDPDTACVRAVIDDVLAGLPAKYRAPIVLCELEGRSRAEAARALGWTEGTLSGRLARAKKLLADRLARRGVTLPAAGLAAALLAQPATASVPAHLAASTVQAAALVAAGAATAEVASGPVAALAREGCPTMNVPFKALAATVTGIGLAIGGFGLFKLFDKEPIPTPNPSPTTPVIAEVNERPAPRLAPAGQNPVPQPQEWALAHTWRLPGRLTTLAVGTDFILAGDQVGTIAVFELKTKKERHKLRQGNDNGAPPGIDRLQFLPDGVTFIMVLEDTGFHQSRVDRKLDDTRYPRGIAEYRRGKSFGLTTDGREWLLFSKADNALRVVRNLLATRPFADETEVVFTHPAPVEFAAGDTADAIATVTNARFRPVLRFWGQASEKPLWEVKVADYDNIDVTGVAVAPGGKLVAITGDAGQVWIFDAKTGKRVATADKLTGPVWGVAFSPDGKRLAVGCGDKIARVIDAATGTELAVLKGHTEEVTSVAFGPDGNTLATGSADKTVKVWEFKK